LRVSALSLPIHRERVKINLSTVLAGQNVGVKEPNALPMTMSPLSLSK
jgi:hypothetical protein